MTSLRKYISDIDLIYQQVGQAAFDKHIGIEEKKMDNIDPKEDPWKHAFVEKLYEFFMVNGFVVAEKNVLFRLPTEPNAYGSFYNADKFRSKVKKFIEKDVMEEVERLIHK